MPVAKASAPKLEGVCELLPEALRPIQLLVGGVALREDGVAVTNGVDAVMGECQICYQNCNKREEDNGRVNVM